MSMMLMVKAMQMKVGNPLRKLVLLKLADNANDKGECWPSYQHIAEQCEIARSTVKNHVRDLEEAGLLKRVFRKEGTKNKSNIFVLTLDEVKNKSMGGSGDDLGQQMPEVGQEITEGGSADDRGVGHQITPEPVITESVKEPVKESVKTKAKKSTPMKFNTSEFLQSHNVSDLVIQDFIAHRKNKKAEITMTALNGIIREAGKANISLERALTIAIERNWVSFNASWKWQDDAITIGGNVTPFNAPSQSTGNKQIDLENRTKAVIEQYLQGQANE